MRVRRAARAATSEATARRAAPSAPGGARTAARAAWTAWGLCVALILSSIVLERLTPYFLVPPERPSAFLAAVTAVLSLACPTVGALVASRLPANPVGWIFCGVGLLYGVRRLSAAYADQALLARPWLPGGEYAAWVSTWLGFPVLMAAGVFLALLFPGGRLQGRWPRVLAHVAAGGAAAVCLSDALRPGPLRAYYYAGNPLGLPAVGTRWLPEALGAVGGAALSAACVAAALSLVLRLRGAVGDGRQQLGWFACGAVPALLGAAVMLMDRAVAAATSLFLEAPFRPALQAAGVLGVFVQEGRLPGPLTELRLETTFELLAVLALFTVPVFTGVAVLRHRLYDVDLVINRALVYATLTAAVISSYVLLVAGFGALFQAGSRGNLAFSLLATGAIAALFQPLRARLQRAVDRLMYGQRHDPYGALSGLGERLEATLAPEAVLPTVVETVARAMKTPYAAIVLRGEDGIETAASRGSPAGEVTTVPLRRGDELVGWLKLSPPPGEPFSPADHRLLRDLARQTAAAVEAVRLTAALRRSRERLVKAREEERRRLRRDLHDGLGPTLAGLSFGLEAARRLAEERPRDAGDLLARLEAQAQDAMANVRRLVYGLRPPALDDVGLVAAIRRQAEAYGSPGGAGAVLSVESPETLPTLPAATEVAAYRIAQEAIANVHKHAAARSCRVGLRVREGALELEISDDGTGIGADAGSGVGLFSMRERAEELGGTCEILPNPGGGTRVLARLPLEPAFPEPCPSGPERPPGPPDGRDPEGRDARG